MKLLCLVAASLAYLAASRSTSSAFELERVNNDPCSAAQNVFWPSRLAVVNVALLQPPQFAQLADTARVRWNESVAAFRFALGDGEFCNMQDGVVTLGFSAATCGGDPFEGEAIAVTVTRFDGATGHLSDANVLFDVREPAFQNPTFFLEVAMHELGHVLGLDHSDACGKSGAGTLMKSTINRLGPRLDRPQLDDIEGATFIYAALGSGENPLVGSGGNSCAVRPHRRGSNSGVLGALLLVLCRCLFAAQRPAPERRAGTPASRPAV